MKMKIDLLTVTSVSGENPKPYWNKDHMNVRSRHMNGLSVLELRQPVTQIELEI